MKSKEDFKKISCSILRKVDHIETQAKLCVLVKNCVAMFVAIKVAFLRYSSLTEGIWLVIFLCTVV